MRRRRPDLRGLLVPKIELFARRVGDRMVRPGGETVLPAVDRPGKSSARFVDDTAEIVVCENVAPGSRRVLPRPEVDCIFPAVLRKATEAIVETQVHRPGKRRLHLVRHACPGGLKTRRRRVRLSGSRKLLRERTSRLVENNTRNGFEQTHLVLAHLVREEQVHAPAAAQELVCAQFVKQREDALAHRLHVAGDARAEYHEIDVEPAPTPELVSADEDAQETHFARLVCAKEQDGKITREPEAPEAWLAEPIRTSIRPASSRCSWTSCAKVVPRLMAS